MARVFVAIPTYDGNICSGIVPALFKASSKHMVHYVSIGSSALAHGFNMLWKTARSMHAIDYFVMIHADILPAEDGIVRLIDIMKEHQADVVSAVSPIKNVHGNTSTAIGNPDDKWEAPRRLTLTEIFKMPPTFDAAGAGFPDKILMVNTGFMAIDFRKPWIKRFPGFTMEDRLATGADGKLEAQFLPEDWAFSRYLYGEKAKVLATRETELHHYGNYPFTNSFAWGDEEIDAEWVSRQGGGAGDGSSSTTAASG